MFMMKKVYQRIKLLDTKVDFSKFKEDEKSNPELKIFLT
jgi:hypothetical protein